MPLVTQRDMQIIPYYNARLERLHLKMGQQFSHKFVLRSRPWRLLFVLGISQKTALWAPEMVGECHLRCTVAAWGPGAAHPNAAAAPSPPPPTSFSRKPERRGGWGGHFSEANTGSPHVPCAEGAWAPHPSQSHLLTTWALHTGDTAFLQNWLKEDEWYGNIQFQAVLKPQCRLWPCSQVTLTCPATLRPTALLPPANPQGAIPGCTGPFSKR